jgi:hypothetical protein
MAADRDDLLVRASLAQNAVLDGVVQRLTAGGDDVTAMRAHLEEEPRMNVTDLAIAGVRVASSALQWVVAEYGGEGNGSRG